MRRFITSLALVVLATPVMACINDKELPNHEREFRSQYQETVSQPAPPPPTSPGPSNQLVMGIGGVALAGAFAVTLASRRLKN